MAKRLRHCALSLTLLQGGQYLVSLMLLPLLSRRLGLEGYGQFGFCLAIVSYFALIVDWGFPSSASKLISANRDDRRVRSTIFWNVIGARLLLSALVLVLWILYALAIPETSFDRNLVWLGFISVLAAAISPAFYFLGIERVEITSLVILFCRVATVPLIYLLVTGPNDLWVAVLMQCGFLFVSAIVNLGILLRSNEIEFVVITWKDVKLNLRMSATTFLSGAIYGFVSSSFTVTLGLVANSAEVGCYVAAMNILKALQGMLVPLLQPLFPRLSMLFVDQRLEGLGLLKKALYMITPLVSLLAFGVAYFSDWLPIFLGQKFMPSIVVLQILSFQLIFYVINSLIGSQLMIILGCQKQFSKVLFIACFIGVMVTIPLGYWNGANGAAAATLITEALITVCLMIFYKKFYRNTLLG